MRPFVRRPSSEKSATRMLLAAADGWLPVPRVRLAVAPPVRRPRSTTTFRPDACAAAGTESRQASMARLARIAAVPRVPLTLQMVAHRKELPTEARRAVPVPKTALHPFRLGKGFA